MSQLSTSEDWKTTLRFSVVVIFSVLVALLVFNHLNISWEDGNEQNTFKGNIPYVRNM